jgi:hypothetical protein
LPLVHAAIELGLLPINLVVWAKTNAGMGSLYRSQHEPLPLFKKGTAPHVNNVALGKPGRYRSNVWTYPGASSFGSDARKGLDDHPTVKPTAMLEDALIDRSHRNEIILEPFGGSGSTLIACQNTGRICRCIELDPLYLDVIVKRFGAASSENAGLWEQRDVRGTDSQKEYRKIARAPSYRNAPAALCERRAINSLMIAGLPESGSKSAGRTGGNIAWAEAVPTPGAVTLAPDLRSPWGLDSQEDEEYRLRRLPLPACDHSAGDLRKRRLKPYSTWHLDEVYLKISGRMVYLWRAVDAEGEVLDVLIQRKRNKHAALKLMRKLLKKCGFVPDRLITDDLRPETFGMTRQELP